MGNESAVHVGSRDLSPTATRPQPTVSRLLWSDPQVSDPKLRTVPVGTVTPNGLILRRDPEVWVWTFCPSYLGHW